MRRSEVAIFQWVIYSELFDHVLDLTGPINKLGLDSVTRLRYLAYCVPDANCVHYLCLDPPQWFKEIRHPDPEVYQQLSLQQALRTELTHKRFTKAMENLSDQDLTVIRFTCRSS